jgi:hypothetical protein
MEWTAVFVIGLVTATEVFITIAPYLGLKPEVDATLLSQISQQQTIMQNAFIAALGFLIGSSVGTRKKDDAIVTQANTIAAAQDKLPPVPGAPDKSVPLAAGESVNVKAEDAKP